MALPARTALIALAAAMLAVRPSSVAAQRAPWARTHVFAGMEASHDDQPITSIRPTLSTWGFLTDWTSIGARISGNYVRLADTASRSLTIAAVTLSQGFSGGRINFDGELGAVTRSWGTSADGVGSARLTLRPSSWSTLSARAEHFAYTSTEASLAAVVMPERYTADLLLSSPSGWMGEAQWQDTHFPSFGFVPSGDNDVTSAFGWVLAPVPGVRPGGLQVGYSFGAQSSGRLMYDLERPNQNVPATNPNFDFTGRYSPYYTPRNVRVHSALFAAAMTPTPRVSFHVNAAYGFHATEDAPHITGATFTPRRLAPVVTEVPRSYSPWNVKASLTSAVTRSASLNLGAELLRTAFYAAQAATLSLDYTIGK